MKTYEFYKDVLGNWYIDLPDYPGSKEDLQMILGADVMLDQIRESIDRNLSIQLSSVKVSLSLEPFPNAGVLNHHGLGWYETKDYGMIWLCSVTEWLFGSYPKIIYFTIIK